MNTLIQNENSSLNRRLDHPYTPLSPSRSNTTGKNPVSGNEQADTKINQEIKKSGKAIQSDVYKAYDEKTLKRMGVVECSTCASRKYQDASGDPGVSFKSPTHVSPEASFSAVSAHEQMHVSREQSKAHAKGGVVSQSVTLHSSICPECGRAYTSGGVTHTSVRYPKEIETNYKGGMMDLTI